MSLMIQTVRHSTLSLFVCAALALSGCGGGDVVDDDGADDTSDPTFLCSDGVDNDTDGLIDFPADPGCDSATDNSEDNTPSPACSDGVDNDMDGLIDFPNDPGCSTADDNTEENAPLPQCSDGVDNDGDGETDFPADNGCANADDDNETDPRQCADGIDNDSDGQIDLADGGCTDAGDDDESGPFECSDGIDNDTDGQTDFPDDPGCDSATDDDETDPVTAPQCSDGIDNDTDGETDFPNDNGCDSASDDDETDPLTPVACSDGLDNDMDGQTDFPNDPGCESAADDDETDPPPPAATYTRYEFFNQCWSLRSNDTGNFVTESGGAYSANEPDAANAERFYMKPTALGKYMLYNRNRQVVNANTSNPLLPTIDSVNSASASDGSEWSVVGVGDATDYPATPAYHTEPTPEFVQTYHNFVDPNLAFSQFTLTTPTSNNRLATNGSGGLVAVDPGSDPEAESFSFVPATGCMNFPEANSNYSGTPFSGTTTDGRVLGHTDAHIHISATEFLGGAEWGRPYHKFGIEHALGACVPRHGPTGQQDTVGGLFSQDPDGHATDGYPTFTEWPARNMLTHEALYWRWLERAWAGGLRVIVNDLVDNETLCELQRNAVGEPQQDCNPMNNAGRQAGTMYGMQDYIDAQFGGRGEGFFQIVHTPDEARDVIADGKAAVVLGIEISNLFDCQLTYNPLRTTEPFQEPSSGVSATENRYACTTVEGHPNSILTQMQRVWDWGVRQIISIHEFDNAFGGNGIFDGLILNLGNRENSGGNPTPGGDLFDDPFAFNPPNESPSGEFWTTYNCPVEAVSDPVRQAQLGTPTPGFSGYLWEDKGGSAQDFLNPPLCIPTGQGGRSGGTTPCYPGPTTSGSDQRFNQCNARWMTPAGLYTYKKMMEFGFLIDWDHMEMGMKTQLLELFEAQTPPYPVVSTHGTFGGTTIDQATRALQIGSYLYPSNGSSRGFRNDMNETLGLHTAGSVPFMFGFGYGTDTNGLSGQSGPRGGGTPLTYPFTFYSGGKFAADPQLSADLTDIGAAPIIFDQPNSTDADGTEQKSWHQDVDGTAHGGMVTDWIQEINIEGTPEQMRHLFNSAEVFVQTWERTLASRDAFPGSPPAPVEPAGILRPAPPVGAIAP